MQRIYFIQFLRFGGFVRLCVYSLPMTSQRFYSLRRGSNLGYLYIARACMKKSFFLFAFIFCLLSIQIWCSTNMQGIEILLGPPTAEEFVALRAAAGMKERKVASAEKGILNSLFWITLRSQGKLIGMGRVVGDGGTVVQITDIAVDP